MSQPLTTQKDPITDTLPRVDVGDVVHWYPTGVSSEQPLAAIVTGIGLGGQTLNLNVLDPYSYNLRIRDGVRHLTDPRCKEVEFREYGAWDLTPRERGYRLLAKQVKELLGQASQSNPSTTTQVKK